MHPLHTSSSMKDGTSERMNKFQHSRTVLQRSKSLPELRSQSQMSDGDLHKPSQWSTTRLTSGHGKVKAGGRHTSSFPVGNRDCFSRNPNCTSGNVSTQVRNQHIVQTQIGQANLSQPTSSSTKEKIPEPSNKSQYPATTLQGSKSPSAAGLQSQTSGGNLHTSSSGSPNRHTTDRNMRLAGGRNAHSGDTSSSTTWQRNLSGSTPKPQKVQFLQHERGSEPQNPQPATSGFRHGRASSLTHITLLEKAYFLTASALNLLTVPTRYQDAMLPTYVQGMHHQIIECVESSLSLLPSPAPSNQVRKD